MMWLADTTGWTGEALIVEEVDSSGVAAAEV